MSKPEAFIIPAGLVFEQSEDGLSIEHSGDIILHGTLGLPLKRVASSGGDIVLYVDATLKELTAAGKVTVHGGLTAEQVRGSQVEIHGPLHAEQVHTDAGGLIAHGEAEVTELASGGDVLIHGNTTAEALTSSGNIRLNAQAHVSEISAGGSLHITGEAVVDYLTASGDIDLHSAVRTSDLKGSGSVTVHGNLTASTVTAAGDVRLKATVSVSELSSEASISVSGDIEAATVSAAGDVQVQGDVQVDLLSTRSGDVQIDGDVIAQAIAAGGSLRVFGRVEAEELSAGGSLTLSNTVTARRIKGVEVTLSGSRSQVKAIQGSQAITIGDGEIRSDILIAPRISLSSGTSGKITALEAHEEPGPSSVKGCLSLEDLAEFGIDMDAYLAERGLLPLGSAAQPPEDASPADEDTSEPPPQEPTDDIIVETLPAEDTSSQGNSDEIDIVVENSDSDHYSIDVLSAEDDELPITLGEDLIAIDLSDDDQLSDDEMEGVEQIFDLSLEDDEGEEEGDDDPLYGEMLDTVHRIEACYQGSELPPAVQQLHQLVDARNYSGIRDDITDIWNRLLKFHQKRGLRIQPQVTTTFNTINTLVRKL